MISDHSRPSNRPVQSEFPFLRMTFSFSLLVVQGLIFHLAVQEIFTESTCETQSASNRNLNLLINSWKDEEGEWLTRFHTSNSDSKTTNVTLDLTQTVSQCEDGEVVHIKGLIRANRVNVTDRLKFHPNCGKNAAISSDGSSAEKIKLDDPHNGVILTHRALRRMELFEVRMDKKNNKFNYCLGIGVTIYNPETFTIPDHMYNLKSGNWMMYHAHVYINGAENVKNYGKNFNQLQVGDRVGVMVNTFGTLHFYVNGVDQGPAASNMPTTLYGVFELYKDAAKGTIV